MPVKVAHLKKALSVVEVTELVRGHRYLVTVGKDRTAEQCLRLQEWLRAQDLDAVVISEDVKEVYEVVR